MKLKKNQILTSSLQTKIMKLKGASNYELNFWRRNFIKWISKNDILLTLSTLESDYEELIFIADSLLNKLKSIN